MLRIRSSFVTASIALCVLDATASSTIAGDEASKSPEAILSDVQRDLSKVKSFHFTGHMTDSSGVTQLSGDIFASGSAKVRLAHGGSSVAFIMLPKSTYMMASAKFWRQSGGVNDRKLVNKLARRWVKVPKSARGSFQPLLAELSPKRFASCFSVGTGTLSNNGVKTLGGRKVIVVEAKGDRPGTTPGVVYIAADGPVLPLREVQTGPRRPGGKLDKRCDEQDDTSTAGDATYSQYNRVPSLRAPRNALLLERTGTTA